MTCSWDPSTTKSICGLLHRLASCLLSGLCASVLLLSRVLRLARTRVVTVAAAVPAVAVVVVAAVVEIAALAVAGWLQKLLSFRQAAGA